MVRRLFETLSREVSGVHQAALLLGVASIAAKILALARDHLLASAFGAGETLDIYFSAFRIPDLIFAASFLVTTSVVIIPFLLRKEAQSREAARDFMSGLGTLLAVIMVVIAASAFVTMPWLARFVAPGFSSDALLNLVWLSRILLLSPILLSFSTLISSVLQAHHRFFVYALSPVLYNLGIIAGIAWLYPLWGISGLAWGVVLGVFMHLAIQFPSLIRLGYMPRVSFSIVWRDVADVLKLSLPRSISLGLNQGVVLVFTVIASSIGTGSIAVFHLANNLYSIPMSVIGLSYSVAAFPGFARSFVDGRRGDYADGVMHVARHILFWSLPFVVLFIVLRAHIIRVILGAGQFGWEDTRLTAAALALFSIAIVAQGFIMLFVRAFHAAERAVIPLIAGGVSSALTVAVGYELARAWGVSGGGWHWLDAMLRVADLSGTGVLALPLAFSAGSVLNAVILAAWFSVAFGVRVKTWACTFAEHGMASLALGIVSYNALQWFAPLFDLQTFWGVFGHGMTAAVAGMAALVVVLWILKNHEMLTVAQSIHQKFWKAQVIAPEPESPSQG